MNTAIPCGRPLLIVGMGRHHEKEGPTNKSALAGAPTPYGQGLADKRRTRPAMSTVERPTDTPPPTCPICGERGRGHLLADGSSRKVGNYICPDGHIYIVSVFVDGLSQ